MGMLWFLKLNCRLQSLPSWRSLVACKAGICVCQTHPAPHVDWWSPCHLLLHSEGPGGQFLNFLGKFWAIDFVDTTKDDWGRWRVHSTQDPDLSMVHWLLGDFCVTGVYQAAARRGAAAPGNASAAAAPGAGPVTGNARICLSVVPGRVCPPWAGTTVHHQTTLGSAGGWQAQVETPPWSYCLGHISRWLLFSYLLPTTNCPCLVDRKGFEQKLAFSKQTRMLEVDGWKRLHRISPSLL